MQRRLNTFQHVRCVFLRGVMSKSMRSAHRSLLVDMHHSQNTRKQIWKQNKLAFRPFRGCSLDQTPSPLSKGHRVLGEKSPSGGTYDTEYQVTFGFCFFFSKRVTSGTVKLLYVCSCLWQGLIAKSFPPPTLLLWIFFLTNNSVLGEIDVKYGLYGNDFIFNSYFGFLRRPFLLNNKTV